MATEPVAPETQQTQDAWKIVGVVGGGAMGAGIAYEVARNLDAQIIVREADAHTLARAERTSSGWSSAPRRKGRSPARRRTPGWRASPGRPRWPTSPQRIL